MDQHSERDDELLGAEGPPFDGAAALRRFRARVAAETAIGRRDPLAAIAARLTLTPMPWVRPLAASLAAIVVVAALTVSGVAETILTIFEPKQVVVVRFDPRNLRGIPDLSQYGTLTWVSQPSWRQVASVGAAAADAGFTPLVPATLPQGLPADARVAAMPRAEATFRFDEALARAAAARVGATPPPMPPAVATTTLTMSGGPAVMQQYGSGTDGWTAVASGPLPTAPQLSGTQTGPFVVIVQARAPVVTSNGATVNELRDYALAQPGIPPSVASQIRAIGDPVKTLLLPIGIDLKDARSVTIRGTQGYLVGDETGLGSGIVWLERGYVVGVLGSLKESDLISLVNALR